MPTRVTDLFPTIAGTSAPIDVEDEGVSVDAAANKLNFVGDGVTVTDGPEEGEVTVTVPGGGGGGGTVRDWDMSTDTVTTPLELAADADPYVPVDGGQTIGTYTLTLPIDTTSRFGVASLVESVSFTTPKWVLVRVNTATGTLLAGQNFYSVLFGDPVGDPANAGGISYRPIEDDLYNQFTASIVDAAFTLGDWVLMIFDPTVPEVRVKTAAVNTQISTVDPTAKPINLLIQAQTSSGVGSVQMEISTNPADLGVLDPGTATPMGDIQVVLPAGATVGDFLNVTVGGSYNGTAYVAGDGAVYLDDTPSDIVNRIPNASPVTSSSKVFAVPSQYANMNDALTAAKQFVYVGGAKGIISIDAAHTLTSADVLNLSNVEYPWLSILFNSDTQLDMTGISGVSGFITIANSTIDGITGTLTAINQITLRPIYCLNGRFMTGLGTLGTTLTLNDFYSGVYIEKAEGYILGLAESISALASFPTTDLRGLEFPVINRVTTNNSRFSAYLGDSAVLLDTPLFDGSTVVNATIGRGNHIIWYDSDNPTVEINVEFGENSGSYNVPLGSSASVDIKKLTGVGGNAPTINSVVVREGWSAFFTASGVSWVPTSVNDELFTVRKGAKLIIDSAFTNGNINTGTATPKAICALGRGAVVAHEGSAQFIKGSEYSEAIARLNFVDGGALRYLEKNFVTRDGCAVFVDESFGTNDAVENKTVDITASRSLDYADMGRYISVTSGGGNVDITIESNLDNAAVDHFWITNAGVGTATLVAGVGVTLVSASGNLKIAIGGAVFVKRVGTDRWVASGDLAP